MKATPIRLCPSLCLCFGRAVPSWPRLSSVVRLWTSLVVIGFAGSALGQGTVPERLSFQGYIEDGNGVALGSATPANFDVIFRIFPTATGGASSWTEKQTVTFDKGNYSVLLGQGTEVPPELYPTLSTVVANANGNELYVETSVIINANPVRILPRLRLLPTPYSFLAKKALVADQALNVNGSAIAVGSIPDNRLSANIVSGPIADSRLSVNVTGPVPDSRLSANVALRGAVNTFTANQAFGANVGIGTGQPGARLSVVAPGIAEVSGSALSTTLRTTAGNLGTTANSELALASFGFNSGNNSSLGIRGLRANTGGDWTSTAIGLEMDVDNTVRAGGASVWLHGNGNVGVGTATPGAKLDVSGSIRSTSLTVNGPFTASSFNAVTITANTVNGEKPPVSFTIGPGANLNTYRDVLVDVGAMLADGDGGRIKFILRNYASKQITMVNYEINIEPDGENFGDAGYSFWSVSSYGAERSFKLGATDRGDVAADWNWFWVRNYRSGAASGGVDGPTNSGADRFKLWFMVAPQVTATIYIYDR